MSVQQQGAPALGQPPRKRRTGRIALVVVVGLVVLLAILAVIADVVVRNYAEARAEKEIESSLPAGTTGTVGVSIHGFSVILQALSGHLDDLTLTSKNLVVSGIPLTFDVDATKVPLQSGGTTGPVTGTLRVDQAALNKTKAVEALGGKVGLGSGQFTFDKDITIISQKVTATITATAKVASGGTELSINPTSASLNGTKLPNALAPVLDSIAQTVCVAQYLPKGATLTNIAIAPGVLTLDLHSNGLPLSKSGLTTTGSC